MRELSNHFCIIPQGLICDALKMGESVSIPVGSEDYRCAAPVVFEQTAEESDTGLVYNQTFRGVTDDSTVLRYNNSRVYVGMIFTDGSVEIIGSGWSTPTVIVTPHQGVTVVEASFKALRPIGL